MTASGRVLGAVDQVQDVAGVAGVRIDEVPARGHAEGADDLGRVVAADLGQLVEAPEVELALDPFAVGVLGREEAAVGVAQVAQHVA